MIVLETAGGAFLGLAIFATIAGACDRLIYKHRARQSGNRQRATARVVPIAKPPLRDARRAVAPICARPATARASLHLCK